jgi:hypothetical protein
MKQYINIEKIIKLGMFPIIFLYSLAFKNHIEIYSPSCFFRYLFDVECWGCGMTRAILEIFNFNLKNAIKLNPLSPLVLTIIFLIFCFEIYKPRRTKWLNLP